MKLLINRTELTSKKSSEYIPLECEICKSTFYKPKNLVMRGLKGTRSISTCSRKCKNMLLSKKSNKKKVVVLRCEWCHSEFEKSESQYNKNIRNGKKNFCSKKCVSDWFHQTKFPKLPELITLNCTFCGNEFQRKYKSYRNNQLYDHKKPFCSRRCNAKFKYKFYTNGRSKLEEWIEKKLSSMYPSLKINYNDRDTVGIELDIYIPSLELAFELNGIHHYKPIYGIPNFVNSTFRDVIKEHKCKTRHIDLYVLDCREFSHPNEEKDNIFLEEITKRIEEKLKAVSESHDLPVALITG